LLEKNKQFNKHQK